jgi:hypothetical protein
MPLQNGLERFKKCPKCGKPSKCLKGDKGILCMTVWSSKTVNCNGVGTAYFHPYDEDGVQVPATGTRTTTATKTTTLSPVTDRSSTCWSWMKDIGGTMSAEASTPTG